MRPRAAARGVVGVLAFVALALTAGCASTTQAADAPVPVELNVSAAATLRSVLTSNAPAFERATNTRLVFNFGPSGQLAKQIEGGAPAHVFLSASPHVVATLVAEDLVSAEDSIPFASNTLAILVPEGNPAGIHDPGDLAKAALLTTGDPAVAPYGQSTREWLGELGLWETLEPKMVFAAGAGQGDDYIARGEVVAGIGFASDASGRDDIEVAYTVPDGTVTPIEYVGAAVKGSGQDALAKAYLAYLLSPEMQRAFVDGGLRPAPER